MANEKIDQESLAAEWGVALEAEQKAAVKAGADVVAANGEGGSGAEAMAAQWANMADEGHFNQASKGGAERILTQEEIDSLLGFSLADVSLNDNSGIRAIIDSAMVSYERLPMLEIIFDRLVRLMTTSLRNFTSDNVEVSLDRITSVRFGD
ncbi:MAG: flagellar motor switch protein FliM, partial [Xanthobacteraceae bacterium]